MLAEQNTIDGQNEVEEVETPELIRLNTPEFIAELPPDQYRPMTEIAKARA